MKKIYLLILSCQLSFLVSNAQSDTAFWFAAPDVDVVNNPTYGQYDRPIYLRMTSAGNIANVTVSIPANNAFVPINISIPANSTSTIDLTPWIDMIENFEPSNINNKGIFIKSTTEITAYYEVNSVTCHCNPELFSLKGKNAIGNEFYIPSQITWSIDTIRHPNAKAAFDIVATQNNTSITITPAKPLTGHPANVPFTIILNKGQSYSCQALYRNGTNLLNGSRVISDKPVAVTTKEDLLFTDGACADLAGAQLIPTAIFGNQYAVVRGDLTVRDKVVITANQNNTSVYFNGNAVAIAIINAGQSYETDITSQASLYISSNNTVSVFHYTGSGCEVGAAVIPKLNCTGSSSVSIVRSNSGNAVVLLVTKNGNQGSFLMNGSAGVITSADFSPLPGTAGNYVFAKKDLTGIMPLNTATKISNTTGKFQLGFINGDPGGYMYGYFSDFKKSNVTNSQAEICKLDSTQFNATGGVSYQWSPSTGLNNPNISNPKASPAVTTTYKVVITDIDGCIDSAFVKVIVNNCSLLCDNWLHTQVVGQSVTVGDLDITGNQLTVEGNFNCTAFPVGTGNIWEEIVSKHSTPSDCNYALRMNMAGITTSNGFFSTPASCDNIILNKTYHAAMVYNGSTLKFYRNGFLMSEVAATGNLVLNNLLTTIGDYAYNNPLGTNFYGYLNEIRIWNVARTQAQIQATMNSSLPNPTTQPGLLGYYTFDNLQNKQGNTVFNGTLTGGATINTSNPNCTFLADSCELAPTTPCNSWLSLPTQPSYVNIGDLDIPGNQITVEGTINRTSFLSNGVPTDGDIVSKHTGPNNANYILRPTRALITTSDGFFFTPSVCDILLNKTYHFAMVYDGTTLKFYRNGFLMSQVPATGNLFQNDLNTFIGFIPNQALNENLIGYVNEVRIWNVARTQAEIQSTMSGSLPNPTTQPGLQAYYTFDNLLNKQGNPAWNGTLGGNATINATNPNCTFIADSCAVASCITNSDFIFSIDPCTPYSVKFTTSATTFNSIKWDFGDGSPNDITVSPNHLYTAAGNYTVKMMLFGATCSDTITKKLSVNLQNDNTLISTNDTTICIGNTKQLLTKPGAGLSFCWTPSTYLNNTAVANPITSTPVNITYYCNAEVIGNNVISNGDFSQGNTGFTSQYNYVNNNTTEGEYFVGATPSSWNGGMSPCTDHTGGAGNGNMMLVNGSPVADVQVWSQTVTITPNTNYAFSAWIQALYPVNPALLRFSINGAAVGVPITASLPTCTWNQFYTTWNSGNATSAVISIVNQNTLVQGNDFALDDISFAPVAVKRDSVKITVNTPAVSATGSSNVCAGVPVQLNASGASVYSWTPATGLSNANIANPVATPANSTTYTVTGTNIYGCVAQAPPISITVKPKPVITKSNDTLICKNTSVQLLASGGTNYSWTPAGTLNNPNIANPVATPLAPVTKYYVTVINNVVNACTSLDSVTVTIKPDAVFKISPAQTTCMGTAVQLKAAGGDLYQWTPAGLVSNPNIAAPFTTTTANTNYSVLITDSYCSVSKTLSTAVTVNPVPTVTAQKSNDIDCSIEFANLLASGAQNYTWAPAASLNNSSIFNPVARPVTTTQYIVTGNNTYGCKGSDTLTVAVTVLGKSGYNMPNTFTPNGDGKNDCFGIKYWGIVEQLEFSIFNRYGERVFYTTNPYGCWDGTFKGNAADPGNFVYYIKAKTACGPVEKKGNVLLTR